MKIRIIEENDNWLIIDKPPGIVANRAKTVKEPTVQDWIGEYLATLGLAKWWENKFVSLVKENKWAVLVPRHFDDRFGKPAEIFALRQGLVHRLDKETCGVMVLAKNPGALVNLLAQFKERRVKKEYLALAHGRLGPSDGSWCFPVGRSRRRPGKMSVVASGRPAETNYRVEQIWSFDQLAASPQQWVKEISRYFTDEHFQIQALEQLLTDKQAASIYSSGFSLVRCFPRTGRMHQIRLHLAEAKHPIVGDKLYLSRKLLRTDQAWVNWLCLRSWKIYFNPSLISRDENPNSK